MKRIIVTGAGGFLGTEIMKKAKEFQDLEVVAVTSNPWKIPKQKMGNLRTVSTDIFLAGGFHFAPKDVVINCLYPTNADGYKMAKGLTKVFEIISLAKDMGAGAFINISSQSVYASKRTAPAKEEDALSPETGYAVGKYCCEMVCNREWNNRCHSNIRLASLLGVGYDQRIVNRMIDQALAGEKLKVVGGMQRYGFLDVRDAAEGILQMAVSDPAKWKQVYNLGRMESYTLLEVAEAITKQLKEQGVCGEYIVQEGTDTRNSSVDAGRFMGDFHWKPQIPLSKTIEDIIFSKRHRTEN